MVVHLGIRGRCSWHIHHVVACLKLIGREMLRGPSSVMIGLELSFLVWIRKLTDSIPIEVICVV